MIETIGVATLGNEFNGPVDKRMCCVGAVISHSCAGKGFIYNYKKLGRASCSAGIRS